jgi:hypothetical protein
MSSLTREDKDSKESQGSFIGDSAFLDLGWTSLSEKDKDTRYGDVDLLTFHERFKGRVILDPECVLLFNVIFFTSNLSSLMIACLFRTHHNSEKLL